MNTRFSAVLNVALLASAVSMAVVSPAPAFQSTAGKQEAKATTEDVLHMADGRVLRGQIISETRTQVVFEYRDSTLNMQTKLTLDMDKIAHIERDVPIESGAIEAAPEEPSIATKSNRPTSRSSKPQAAAEAKYGITRVSEATPNVPSIYVVPMRGQIGTDVNSSAYETIVKDIREKKPDVIVIEMDCEDMEDTFAAALGDVKVEEIGMLNFEDHNKLVNLFQKDLREFRQVMWVHNALGMSSVVTLAWKEVYMQPTARLGGMVNVLTQSGAKGWSDSDIRAKMMAFWTGAAKSFLERGGYAHQLGDAMLDPEFKLSVSWKGRNANWRLDESGEYLVDGSDKHSANFTAKSAEDFCISQGTAESLDDLVLMLGYREYFVVDGIGESSIERYVEEWRGALAKAKEALEEYQKFRGWASGEDALKYLGRARASLETVISAIDRHDAVEIRLREELGVSRHNLQVQLEMLKEQIIAAKKAGDAGRSSSGPGRVGGGGAGRGGGM